MALREDFIEALNECIDRLNEGETVDTILSDYPTLANALRPMLEAGLLFTRARIPASEVEPVEMAGETVVRQTVRQVFRSGIGGAGWFLLLLVVMGIGGGILLAVVVGSSQSSPSVLPATTETATATTTIIATLMPTVVATHTLVPTHTLTASAPPTNTPAAATQTPQPLVSTLDRSQIIVEGPVNGIDGNVITIYNLTIRLEPTTPLLNVIRTGDIVRVEGQYEGDAIEVISITFIDVTVVVRDGQAWRADDCGNPPPIWAQPDAEAWYSRCAAPPSIISGDNQNNNSENNNSDDEDDD